MKKILLGAVIFIFLGAGVFFAIKQKPVQIGDYRGESITEIGNDPAIKTFPPAAVEKNKKQLKELAQKLQEDPSNTGLWLAVAQLKKFFNNYLGAVEALKYALSLQPENPLVNYNLANLYGLYLKDYPRAEALYLKAIETGAPNNDYIYFSLAEFYRDFYKEKYDLIDDLLLRGLKEGNQGNPNLIMQLAYYYKSVGDNKNAVKYFRQLISSPTTTGDQQEAFKKEIQSLQ